MAPFTTLGVGGSARLFTIVRSEAELVEALNTAATMQAEIFVLGGGSNILVSDKGFDGLVVKIDLRGITETQLNDRETIVEAKAGENWDDLVKYSVENDLAGVECLGGIPGLVGGTPIQNVGAYGQDVSETIHSVKVFDRNSNEPVEFSNAECGFGYRKSRFNSKDKERFVFISVSFKLERNGKPKIAYKEMCDLFEGKYPTLSEVRDAIISIRRAKSMVINPADPNSKSAGSFFKNPIVDSDKFRQLCQDFENVPSFPASGSSVKIPAAWLIESAGFEKGSVRGRAGISSKHSLALINLGGATAADMISFMSEIQSAVMRKFGIQLEPEPIFVGF